MTSVLGFALFLSVYSFVGWSNHTPLADIYSHATALGALFAPLFILGSAVGRNYISSHYLIKFIVVSVLLYSLLKIFVIYLIDVYGHSEIRAGFESIFGVAFIGLDTGYFYRVHWPADYLLPPVLYWVLVRDDWGARWKALAFLALSAAVIISYSRLIYAFYFISLVLSICFSRHSLLSRVAVFFGGGLFVGCIGYAGGMSFILERYFGGYANSSDSTRSDMFYALLDGFSNNPIFGAGLGAGVPDYINIQAFPWYFELQWFSFLMQFGIIGFLFILSLALYPLFSLLRGPLSYDVLPFAVLYALWLSVGLFNGFMLTSAGGVIFLFFLLLLCSKGIGSIHPKESA